MNNTTFTPVAPGQVATCPVSKRVSDDLRAALYCILIIASLIGNSLVIFVVIRNKRMHTVANYLITNMSIADLLITVLPMNWEVIRIMNFPIGDWPMGQFMCTFVHMCIYLSVACSILSLTVITFDRFFAIIFPLKRILTKKVLPFLLTFIWIASAAFASPTIYAMELVEYGGDVYCVEIWNPPFHAKDSPVHYTIILFVGLYAIPLLTMAVMYSAIALKLWKRVIPGLSSSETEQQILKQKKKVIKMLIVVTTTFAMCWLPVFVVQFIYFTSDYYKRCYVSFPKWFQFLAFFLQYLGSAINPYIYFTFSESYRRGLKAALRCFRKIEPKGTLTTRAQFGNTTKKDSIPTTSNSHLAHDGIPLSVKYETHGIIKEESAMKSSDNLTSLDKNANTIE